MGAQQTLGSEKSPRVGQCRCDSASRVCQLAIIEVRILSSHRDQETVAMSFPMITFEKTVFRTLRKTLLRGSRYTYISNSQMNYSHWQVLLNTCFKKTWSGAHSQVLARRVSSSAGLVLSQTDPSRGLGSVQGCDLELLETMFVFVQVIVWQSSDLAEKPAQNLVKESIFVSTNIFQVESNCLKYITRERRKFLQFRKSIHVFIPLSLCLAAVLFFCFFSQLPMIWHTYQLSNIECLSMIYLGNYYSLFLLEKPR